MTLATLISFAIGALLGALVLWTAYKLLRL